MFCRSENLTLQDGDYVLQVTTQDEQNNTAVWNAEFTVDSVAPEVVIVSTPAKVANTEGSNRHFVLSCPAERCRFVVVVLNHRVTTPATTTWVGAGLHHEFDIAALGLDSGKSYALEVYAEDEAGNAGQKKFYNWTVDRTVPEFVLAEPSGALICEGDLLAVAKPNVTKTGLSQNYSVGFSDTVEQCQVRRVWTVTDTAGNSATKTQVLPIGLTEGQLEFLPFVTLTCDSSQPGGGFDVTSSASVKHACFVGFVLFNISFSEDHAPGSYPCPGSWQRRYVAASQCGDGFELRGNQTLRTVDVCPANACGRSFNPPRGYCLSGQCSCNKPWYGENCDVKILEPKLGTASETVALEEGRGFAYSPNLTQGDQPVIWDLQTGPGNYKNYIA